MNWTKKGLIYKVDGKHGFDVSHCHKPTPLVIDEDTVRIYFGTRDGKNKTRTTFIDLNAHDLQQIKYIHDKPIIDLGKIGTFDDSGANVCSVVRKDGLVLMYYIGVNTSTTVHMRNAIGIAVSEDNGRSFTRMYDGSILDRTKDEPYYTGAVDVIHDQGMWKCYYTSGLEWKIVDGKPEVYYQIKYATSNDGIDWRRDNVLCITPEDDSEVCARPSVYKEDGLYHMYYSKRRLQAFRTDRDQGYRAGYAQSIDGIIWTRKDAEAGIAPSATGWDSDAVAYPYILQLGNTKIMFYNGNDFGKSGFGYAVLDQN